MSNYSNATRSAASIAIAAILGATSLHSAAARWSIADLGAGFLPVDINDHGTVLEGNQVINGQSYSFTSINNLGQAIANGQGGAYIYDHGEFTLLNGMKRANDINDSGQVIGDCAQDECGVGIWQSGNVTVFNGSHFGEGSSINAGGQFLAHGFNRHDQPVAFTYDGKSVSPMGLEGSTSTGRSINDMGAATGNAWTRWDLSSHAFLHDSGVTHDLGTLGGWNSYGWDLNNKNDVVGFSEVSLTTFDIHAFLYRDGNMIDLSLLPEVQAAGWETLTIANAINEQGQIVGSGTLGGVRHGFLLQASQVPEPGTWAFALMGLALAFLRRPSLALCRTKLKE